MADAGIGEAAAATGAKGAAEAGAGAGLGAAEAGAGLGAGLAATPAELAIDSGILGGLDATAGGAATGGLLTGPGTLDAIAADTIAGTSTPASVTGISGLTSVPGFAADPLAGATTGAAGTGLGLDVSGAIDSGIASGGAAASNPVLSYLTSPQGAVNTGLNAATAKNPADFAKNMAVSGLSTGLTSAATDAFSGINPTIPQSAVDNASGLSAGAPTGYGNAPTGAAATSSSDFSVDNPETRGLLPKNADMPASSSADSSGFLSSLSSLGKSLGLVNDAGTGIGKNILPALGLGASVYGQKKQNDALAAFLPNGAKTAQQAVASTVQPAAEVSRQLIHQYQSGTLSPSQAQQISDWEAGQLAQVRQYYQNAGIGTSDMAVKAEGDIRAHAQAMRDQALQNLLQSGLSAVGTATGPLSTISQQQIGQDTALQTAMQNFLQAQTRAQVVGSPASQTTAAQAGEPAAQTA